MQKITNFVYLFVFHSFEWTIFTIIMSHFPDKNEIWEEKENTNYVIEAFQKQILR